MLSMAYRVVSQVDLDLTSTGHVFALPNTYHHFHYEYVYCTNGIERQKFGGPSQCFIFPMLYSQALRKKCTNFFLTLSVRHMHHLTKGHSGINKFITVSTPKSNVKVFSEVNKWCIDYILCKVKYNIISLMIAPLHEALLEISCGSRYSQNRYHWVKHALWAGASFMIIRPMCEEFYSRYTWWSIMALYAIILEKPILMDDSTYRTKPEMVLIIKLKWNVVNGT